MCDIPDLLNKAIEKKLLKALGNLTTGLVNMPICAIERRDAEKLAETNARIAITQSAAKQISEQLKVPVEYVKTAGIKHAAKMVKEQLNLGTIVAKTMEGLQDIQANEADTESQIGNISDELNQFREVACKTSSEDAQDLFSKLIQRYLLSKRRDTSECKTTPLSLMPNLTLHRYSPPKKLKPLSKRLSQKTRSRHINAHSRA